MDRAVELALPVFLREPEISLLERPEGLDEDPRAVRFPELGEEGVSGSESGRTVFDLVGFP